MSEEIRRAIDPETGLPFEKPTAIERFVGWMLEKYFRKIILKVGVVSAPIIGMIAAKLGNTPSASEAIGIGLSAAVLGIVDLVVSYVGKRLGYNNLQSLQKLSEEQDSVREQPAVPFTSDSGQSFTHSAMFQPIIAKATSTAEDDQALLAQSRPMTPAEVKASSAAFWDEMKTIAKPTSPSDDDAALVDEKPKSLSNMEIKSRSRGMSTLAMELAEMEAIGLEFPKDKPKMDHLLSEDAQTAYANYLDLKASLEPKPISMPTDEEIRQSELKQHGFAVESWDKDNGEPTVTYYETKFLAIAFRDAQRLNHVRANLL